MYTVADPKKPPRPKKPYLGLKRSYMVKRAPKRLSRPGTDLAYLAKVRTLPCFVASSACWGRIHAHHAIHRSQGGKDDVAVPLCFHHHACWHGAIGVFTGLSRMQRFAWAMKAIAVTREAIRGGTT